MTKLFDNPTIKRLQTILTAVRAGEILIPDFQRPFEWNDEQRLMLLDSVWKGMPIGSFLLWRTRKPDLKTRPRLGPFPMPDQPPEGEPRTYLLDGHQRLATLYAALTHTDDPAALDREGFRWPMYFDLDPMVGDESRRFKLARANQGPPETWLPLSRLFDPVELFDFQRRLVEAGRRHLASEVETLANTFKDYEIPLVPLIADDLDLVTDSFVRINSQGKPMAEVHIVRALSYFSYSIDERLEVLRERLRPSGWSALRDKVFINALMVRFELDVYKASPRALFEQLKGHGYEEPFDSLEESINHAAEVLQACEVRGPQSLPYEYQLICLAEIARRREKSFDTAAIGKLKIWFWATTYTNYFAGMTNRQITDAVSHVADLVAGKVDPLPNDMVPKVKPIESYYYSANRSRAFVLMMVSHIEDDAIRREAADELGRYGADAVAKVLPREPGDRPENRVMAPSSDLAHLRDILDSPSQGRLSFDNGNRVSDNELLRRYFIDSDARAEFIQGNYEAFFERRRRSIDERENEWIKANHLQPSS